MEVLGRRARRALLLLAWSACSVSCAGPTEERSAMARAPAPQRAAPSATPSAAQPPARPVLSGNAPTSAPPPSREPSALPRAGGVSAADWEGVFRPGGAPLAAPAVPWTADGDAFQCNSPSGARWRVRPAPGQPLRQLRVLDEGGAVQPLYQAWLLPRAGERRLRERRVADGKLVLDYEDGVREVLTCYGTAVAIELSGPARGVMELSLGGLDSGEGVRSIRELQVPYFDQGVLGVVVLRDGSVRYLSAWLDPLASGASDLSLREPGAVGQDGEVYYSQRALYFADSNGQGRPLRERIWVSWSEELLDVLPAMARAPAPLRSQTHEWFYLDLNLHPFAKAQDALSQLEALGLTQIQVWMRQWQRDGYDRGYPSAVMPPREEWGGLAGLDAVARTAQAAGWRFALHHNWVFNGEDLPGASLLDQDGEVRVKSDTGGRYLKPKVALELVDRVEGEFHRSFRTQGSYTDSLTAMLPVSDLDARAAGSGGFQASILDWGELLLRLRTLHGGGPVCGEGSLGFGGVLWAGWTDVVHGYPGFPCETRPERTQGRNAPLVPHFALERLNAVNARAGLGEPPRFLYPDWNWFRTGYDPSDRDWIHAYAAACGNAAYSWWYEKTVVGDVARDWWSTFAAARLLGQPGRRVSEIRYLARNGTWQSLEAMLALGEPLGEGSLRLCVRYSDGLGVWVNATREPWSFEPNPGQGQRCLAPYGRLVAGAGIENAVYFEGGAAYECLRSENERYVDGRGQWHSFAGLGSDGAVGWRRIDAARSRVFPIARYRLAGTPAGVERYVEWSRWELAPEHLSADGAPARLELVYLGREERELGRALLELAAGEPLRVSRAEFERHGALALEIRVR